MYLFDVHVHTAEVSHCAHLPAAQTIDIYADLGYSGVCITDHYSQDALYNDIQEPLWEKKIAAYQRGYYLAKEQGEKRGLTVLFGMEMHVADYPENEYLVYGLTADFVAQNKDLRKENAETINLYNRTYRRNNPLLVEQWRRNATAAAYFKMMAEAEEQNKE